MIRCNSSNGGLRVRSNGGTGDTGAICGVAKVPCRGPTRDRRKSKGIMGTCTRTSRRGGFEFSVSSRRTMSKGRIEGMYQRDGRKGGGRASRAGRWA